ncbi:serine hydrolase domain-containing protein [Algibacter pectinivorans]|uniref:CubicO group peptidase, beta-lactamase class C family n=1 Tax=Algibacter pectinivorans TaxID=870482 RepID=A0A1I1QSY7_9FLAO|nr:serine hydrolase domain-containing protein [Algibacter pectinivorans]SFD21160.1 CubicO group peptidase, beta-lactamase class C family [Algibacter pectinivorans]
MKNILASLLFFFTSVGFNSAEHGTSSDYRIKTAKKRAKQFMRQQGIPGMSISVSQHGKLIWSEGFGYAKRKPKVKVDPNKTLFRIASISKSITALALAHLVDKNQIDLNKSIYSYLPNYPKKAYDFNIKELGGHLAGIRHYKGNEFLWNKKTSITEGVNIFKNDSLLFEPSTQFSYNTFGYVLLSEIMQKAARTDFNELVTQTVFSPLGMTNTLVEDSEIPLPNKTDFYRKKRMFSTPVANEYKVAGGGFLSTSEDLIKFGEEIISPKTVSAAALLEMTTSQKLKSGKITGYGIGFSSAYTIKNTPKYYHTGGGVGASTVLLIYPKENIVISVLTNKTGVKMDDFAKILEGVFIN